MSPLRLLLLVLSIAFAYTACLCASILDRDECLIVAGVIVAGGALTVRLWALSSPSDYGDSPRVKYEDPDDEAARIERINRVLRETRDREGVKK